MSEVNAVNMSRWIVALRSGKYEQGHGRLRTGDKFCCLAVQCDISGLGKWNEAGLETMYVTPTAGSSKIMPREVVEALFPSGIATPSPILTERAYLPPLTCIAANDVHSWSFTQIADALESRYLPNTTAAEVLAGEA